MTYPITQKYISRNRSGQALTPVGMVLHSTADPGATDENEQAYFNSGDRHASAHAFIDWDSITETIPDNEVAWHAGSTANHSFLGVELCEPGNYNPTQFLEIWKRAVWYFAYKFINKLKISTITKDNLMSHAEVSAKYKETDHQDPVSFFNKYGKTVDNFRTDVQTEINKQINIKPDPAPVATQSVNNDTLRLQQTLNRLKIRDAKGNVLVEDGLAGSSTKEAIKRFQSICGLSIDGVPGQPTLGAINQILAKPFLQVGSKGLVVRYLQYRVGVIYDGDFGLNTNRAVIVWQGQNGLVKDGKVGLATWSKLIG